MPRASSSRSSPSRRSSPSVPARTHTTSSVSAVPSAPTYAGPSFGQAIKEGVAYGVGSSIGHRLTSALFGAPVVAVKEAAAAPAPVASPSVCSRYTELKAAMDSCVKDAYDCTLQIEEYRTCIKEGARK